MFTSFGVLAFLLRSRHNGAHFFDISTSKNGPNISVLMCFVHFDFEMCFAPNGVHFFDIPTSKSGPNMRCFVHFDFEMCFAPQRRALFRHRNFETCSEREVFLAFSLAPQRRAIFHLSSGQLAPHPPL